MISKFILCLHNGTLIHLLQNTSLLAEIVRLGGEETVDGYIFNVNHMHYKFTHFLDYFPGLVKSMVQNNVQKMWGGAANVSASTIVVISVARVDDLHFVANHKFVIVVVVRKLEFKMAFVAVENTVHIKHSAVHLV